MQAKLAQISLARGAMPENSISDQFDRKMSSFLEAANIRLEETISEVQESQQKYDEVCRFLHEWLLKFSRTRTHSVKYRLFT